MTETQHEQQTEHTAVNDIYPEDTRPMSIRCPRSVYEKIRWAAYTNHESISLTVVRTLDTALPTPPPISTAVSVVPDQPRDLHGEDGQAE